MNIIKGAETIAKETPAATKHTKNTQYADC